MRPSKLAPLSKGAVVADQPLLFPIYNNRGTLLAEKGTLLTFDQAERISKFDQIFTLNRALLSGLEEESNTSLAIGLKMSAPLKRLRILEETLHEVYSKPIQKTSYSKILTLVTRIQSICEKSPDAAIAKLITDTNDNYTIRHAIHTAILCELSAAHMNWELEERRNIIGAALTMNISMGFLQDKLQDQAQPLTLEQRQLIHDHPKNSVDILKKLGVSNRYWLELVNKHHENTDGSGYPDGIREHQIPLGASLVTLSDIYCAKVTGRSYREPIFANIAARDIFLEKDQTKKGTLIEVFVKVLGLYPPGCFVKLKSGEKGVVIKRGDRLDTPTVLILSDNKNPSISLKIRRQTSSKNFSIQSIISSEGYANEKFYDDIWPY